MGVRRPVPGFLTEPTSYTGPSFLHPSVGGWTINGRLESHRNGGRIDFSPLCRPVKFCAYRAFVSQVVARNLDHRLMIRCRAGAKNVAIEGSADRSERLLSAPFSLLGREHKSPHRRLNNIPGNRAPELSIFGAATLRVYLRTTNSIPHSSNENRNLESACQAYSQQLLSLYLPVSGWRLFLAAFHHCQNAIPISLDVSGVAMSSPI